MKKPMIKRADGSYSQRGMWDNIRDAKGSGKKPADGGDRIRPGTAKGSSYCARSYGIKKGLPEAKQNDPNTPNNLSRRKWRCKGSKSMK